MMCERIANECVLGCPGLTNHAYERFDACSDFAIFYKATQELGRP